MALTKVPSSMQSVPFRKNLIINGNFQVWQRGNTITNPNDKYTADRWHAKRVGTGVVNVLRNTTDAPPGHLSWSLQVDVTTALASVVANSIYTMRYIIEGYDSQVLLYGSTSAKDITISFWVKSTVIGTYCVSIQNQNLDRAYIKEYEVNVSDTWEYKTLTFPGATDGTWSISTGAGLVVHFVQASGTDHQGAADTWLTANDLATSNQVNALANLTDNFLMSEVQLEIGDTATEFEPTNIVDTLSRCQRYYVAVQGNIIGAGSSSASTNARFLVPLPTELRTTPTLTYTISDFRCRGNGTNHTPTGSITIKDVHSGGLAIEFVISGGASSHAFGLQNNNTDLEIDAENSI